jgi:hypothetical protein
VDKILTYTEGHGGGIGVANLNRGNAALLVAATVLGYGQAGAAEGEPVPTGPDQLFTAQRMRIAGGLPRCAVENLQQGL